jgi:hypothetical protein
MQPETALRGIRLKIQRANTHIREVKGLIDAYLAPDPYETFTEINPVKRSQLIKIRTTEQPPLMIAIISGEILYDLRSALDHLITAIATRRGIVVIERTGFPIERTRKEFERTLHQRKVEQRLPDLADALKRFEPYEGGSGNLLWWLHWLNGMEKHKVVLTVAGANVGYSLKGELRPTPEFDGTADHTLGVPRRWQSLDKEATLFVHPIGTEFRGEMELQMCVVFGDLQVPQAQAVPETLQQISDFVTGITDTFERLFFTV